MERSLLASHATETYSAFRIRTEVPLRECLLFFLFRFQFTKFMNFILATTPHAAEAMSGECELVCPTWRGEGCGDARHRSVYITSV